jgi:Cof subfamily protein (haloacid dehalogenase superfamily)
VPTRLIAADLDGTLLDSRGELSARTIAALRAADDAGIVIVFATGRPPTQARVEVAAVGPAVRYGVMANGSMICSLPDREALHTVSFPNAVAFAAIERLRAHDPRFGFGLVSDRGFTQEAGFAERMPMHQGADEPVADVLTGHDGASEVMKLIAFHNDHSAHELLAIVPAIVGDHLVVSHLGAEAVELSPAGVDKGAGVRWLCDHLTIDAADVVAFGDEINDLAMFRFAGRSIAVANAALAVRQAADEITDSNDDDGVAKVIERLLNA